MVKSFYDFVDWKKYKDNIFCRNDNTTYFQLKNEIEKKFLELKNVVKKDDVVVIKLVNSKKTLVYYYAINMLEAIIVPINYFATIQETKDLIQDVQANVLVLEKGVKRFSESKNRKMFSKNTSMVFHTSGTTGKPKIVPHTNQSVYVSCFEGAKVLNIAEKDIIFCNPPLSSTYGFGVYGLVSLLFGASVVFFDFKILPDKPKIPINIVTYCAKLLDLIKKYKITVFYSIPSTYRISLGILSKMPQKYDLSSLRILISSSEPTGVLLHNAMNKTFSNAKVLIGFGCTESFHAITSSILPSNEAPSHLPPITIL